MDARLVEFAEILRQNGMRVSSAEVLEAATAVSEVGVEDAPLLKAALATTLVKRVSDREAFDRAFTLYFSGATRTLEALDRSLLKAIQEQGFLEGDELEMVLATLQRLLPEMSPMAEAIGQGDRSRMAGLLRGAALQLDLSRAESSIQTGFFARRLGSAAGLEQARTELDGLVKELARQGLSSESLEWVSREVSNAMRRVEEVMRREVATQLQARLKPRTGLAARSLHTLSTAEVKQAEVAVRRLAQKLKARLSRRLRSRTRGALHVRRTLRRNMTWGGVPMVPVFRAKRPQRPEVVVLCDVSDSVRNVSRLMLLFTYTLQSLFARVRSFVFVSDIAEVTNHFKLLDVDEAIDVATAGRDIAMYGNSNYGRALSLFSRDHLGSITRRTTVIVIGDGRNNYNPANGWALEDVRRKCKRLIWICPEERRSWGLGDSEMRLYAARCHQVQVVQSLNDLTALADQLIV